MNNKKKMLKEVLMVVIIFSLYINVYSDQKEIDVLKAKDILYDWIDINNNKKLSETDTITIKLALNEIEQITFWLKSRKVIENLNIKMPSILLGKNDKKIVLESYEILHGIPAKLDNEDIFKPFFLVNFHEMVLNKDELVYIWVNIEIPDDSQQGKYIGYIEILEGIDILVNIKLCIEVYPIKLLNPDISFGMYYDEGRNPNIYSSLKYQKIYFEDMKRHGMNTTTIYNYPEVLNEDGSVYCNFEQSLAGSKEGLNNVMNTLNETGLVANGMPIIFISKKYGNSLGSGDLSKSTIKEIIRQSREKDWPEFIFYMVDEPGRSKKTKRAKAIYNQSYGLLHESLRPKLITAIAPIGIDKVGELYDIWVYYSYYSGQINKYKKLAQELGKEFWIYDCKENRFDPGEQRYFAGLFTYKAKAKGNFCWAYIHYKDLFVKEEDNILPDSAPKYGYVLPSENGPITFIKWEGRREGIDDYRYLLTLSKAIKKAKIEGKTEEVNFATQTLNSIVDSIELKWKTLSPQRHQEIKDSLASAIILIQYSMLD